MNQSWRFNRWVMELEKCMREKNMAKEMVYDDIYGRKKVSYESPHGLIAFIYRKLKKFEVNRY